MNTKLHSTTRSFGLIKDLPHPKYGYAEIASK